MRDADIIAAVKKHLEKARASQALHSKLRNWAQAGGAGERVKALEALLAEIGTNDARP